MNCKIIKTEAAYQKATKRSMAIFQAKEGSTEADEVALLLLLLKDYKDKHIFIPNMKLKKFHTIIDNTPEDVKEEVNLSMDILERIHELLDEKFDSKQKLLADKLNKSEAEISKWLSGVQNFTIKTLVKLEIAFGEPIIAVCTKNKNLAHTIAEKKRHNIMKPLLRKAIL
jgi:transcriptional regulator with XRE-family HTH domain